MSRKIISASKTGLLSHCRYPFRKDAQWLDKAGPAAEQGKILHARAENYILGKKVTAGFNPDAEDGKTLSRWQELKKWIDEHKTNTTLTELSFAWDPATGKARKTGTNRAYVGIRSGEICGTADWVDPGRSPITVLDFKSGQLNLEAAELQLSTLAVMAADVYGVSEVEIGTIHIDNVLTDHRRVLTSMELAAHAGMLHRWMAEAEMSKPNPGSHCVSMYCPHISFCPATTESIEHLVPVEALVARHRFSTDISDPSHAAFCLERLEAIERMAEQVKEALKAKASEWGGIPLPGGKVWKAVDSQTTRTNVNAMRNLAKRLGASDQQLSDCETVTTFQSFRKVNQK